MESLAAINIATAIATPILGVLFWLVRAKADGMQEQITSTQGALNDFKVEVAKTYPSRESLKDALAPILEELRKIDETQRRLFEKLEAKADR